MTTMTCSICLEDTGVKVIRHRCIAPKKHEIKILKCRHVFHSSCIKKWYSYGGTCPSCRTQIAFHHHGSYYQSLLDSVQLSKLFHIQQYEYFDNIKNELDYLCKYNYFDNSGKLLYVECIQTALIHFCAWYINKNTLDTPI